MVFIIMISQQTHPVLLTMKILLLTTLVAFVAADVSHLLATQGYQYQNPSFENAPQSSYGVPQASVLGNFEVRSGPVQSVSYSGSGSAGEPQLTLPSASGPSLQFNGYPAVSSLGGASSISGATIQTYDNGGFSTPVPLTKDSLASFQVSTPSPIGSSPSVNFVKYQEPANSYQFLSKFNQPAASTGFNAARFGSDASLNSGSFSSDGQFNAGFGLAGSTADSVDSQFNSGLGLGGSHFVSKSSGIGGSINDAFGDASGSIDVSGQTQGHLEPEVSKHLYFFDAPEDEEEEAEAKINIPPVAPKKTYKIIFIKAPSYRSQGTITIPAPPATEEKTLVYVLVKKPEKNANVRFQTAAPTQPSKPEVFFIKYKTQKDAEAAVAEIQNKHGATGQVIANLPAGQSIDHIEIPSDIGSSAGKSGGFSGSSFDSFGPSGPSAFGVEARLGISASQDEPQQQDSDSAQSENAQANVQFGQAGASGLSSANFGQQSGSSFQSFGGAAASSQSEASAPSAFGSEGTNESNVDAGDEDESQNESSSSQPEESENNDEVQIQERISNGSSDSEGQGSALSGFKTYGAPDPSLFKKYGPPDA